MSDASDSIGDTRIVCIDQEFTDEACAGWMRDIIEIDSNTERREEPIILLINSTGGDVYNALGLIDLIDNCKSPVYTVCVGKAFSSASVLLISGKKRFMTKRSTMMIHQVSTSVDGLRADEMVNHAMETNRLQQLFLDIYKQATGMHEASIRDWHKKDTFLSADECLKLKLIDEIGIPAEFS